MDEDTRILESERFTLKLLNGTSVSIRPLTLAERKKCLSLLPAHFDKNNNVFVEQYMQAQIDIIHYIVSRENKDFKKEDVEKLIDSSLIAQIVKVTLKDPFSEVIGLT